jgi:hypothetical protein
MKKIILGLLILTTAKGLAQYTAKDIFTAKSLVWYGLNFSAAKMIGQFDQAMGAGPASSSDIKNKWIPQWNNLIQGEPQNFKLAEAFRKEAVFYDVAPTAKQNYQINDAELMSFNHTTFSDPKKTIGDIIAALPVGEKTEGIGVTFVVETFDKTATTATIYVVIFDIKTKAIFVLDRAVGKPMGVGLRNFWAGAIKHIIKQIEGEYYERWKTLAK